jgi:hypothetical protein
MLIFSILLAACDATSNTGSQNNSTLASKNGGQTHSFQSTSNQPITYSTNPHTVLIRTFYGGGLYSSLSLAPQVSIYGDGTYIIGLTKQGKLTSDALQQLLNTLINSYGLLGFTRQQFFDVQDQNATFLELALNGKREELVYGAFGTAQESKQDMDEYHRLNQALTTINEALQGKTYPYHGTNMALLVHRIFQPDYAQTTHYWPLFDFTLAQASAYECGLLPSSYEPNPESACLKFVIPIHAILLNATQIQTLQQQLNGQQGLFAEGGNYYQVTLRPLLPDELPQKTLAMFGSAQGSYRGVPLLSGTVPPVPTATPQ